MDLTKAPAKLVIATNSPATREVRVDIVQTIYDVQRGRFMALVRSHVTGKLSTTDVENLVVGTPQTANLG